jgi:aerobic C4-dicarboxylate transport protein
MTTVATSVDLKFRAAKPLYASLWAQVLVAIVAAVALGHFSPARAIAMKPFGDAFIKLVSMIITAVIFCTVVSGIGGMQDIKKVGRVGGKALLRPGDGLNVNTTTLDAKAVADYAGQAKAQNATDFLLHIIPATVVDSFAKGDILQVLFVAILFGVALSAVGPRGKFLANLFEALNRVVFAIVNIIMRLAPIGAFGAMAYTVGRYGIVSLGPLVKLIGAFYFSCVLFVILVLGLVSWIAGFSIIKFLVYIKEEVLLVLATSSSETALPALMEKLEALGCSKTLVGLVVPTGFTFNTDGSSLYMTLAALFVAQATNTHLTFGQQLTIFAVAILTSKGSGGVQGAGFIALVGTLSVIPTIPVAGMALVLGIDRFMGMFRALVNMIGNGVATIVVARWEKEIDRKTLQANFSLPVESAEEAAVV